MHEESENARVEAFSDGVFGIAMTLLVIEIKVPSHELVATQGLGHAPIGLWPSYLAFLTSPTMSPRSRKLFISGRRAPLILRTA
jgi:uncharacterized membrane protein